MNAIEVNFDGLVGPTHNYSGLSYGNIASINSEKSVSNPKEAALQGLEKMKYLSDLGLTQALLPPLLRPNITILRSLGFTGDDAQILSKAWKECPEIVHNCYSAASMWTANAATISPSADTADHKLHITPANLSSKFHRSIEALDTEKLFRQIFADEKFFSVHSPLPQGQYFADEGAANHNRFCKTYAGHGVELFVWGRTSLRDQAASSKKFPPRQTYEASSAIARLHQLDPAYLLFAQQSPEAIDAGVFHNDVISVGNQNIFLFHERAFVDTNSIVDQISQKLPSLIPIAITENQLSLNEAVSSYFFNSQLVTLPDQSMRMIAPSECLVMDSAKSLLDHIVQDKTNPITGVDYLNLHQSMANGGGPACLRLRVVLTKEELKAMHQGIILTPQLYESLKQWINKYYRERLHPQDFGDTELLRETRAAGKELGRLLHLNGMYE